MKWLVTLTISGLCLPVQAQEDSLTLQSEWSATRLNPPPMDHPVPDHLYENAAWLRLFKLDLNRVTEQQLNALGILSPRQAHMIISHRKQFGSFGSLLELQSVDSLPVQTLSELAQYLFVRPARDSGQGNDRISGGTPRGLISWRTDHSSAFDHYQRTASMDNRYAGSPWSNTLRLRLAEPGEWSAGLTVANDAGEPYRWDGLKQLCFDNISAHVQLQSRGRTQNLIVGDYHAQFGQGLLVGSGFRIGRGADPIVSAVRAFNGFSPNHSVQESGYLHGVAHSYSITNEWTAHFMASSRREDGITPVDSTGEWMSSILRSGYHRSPNEQLHRKTILESQAGIALSRSFAQGALGALVHVIGWDHPWRQTQGYANGHLPSSSVIGTSFFGHWSGNRATVFGEGSMASGTPAGIVGLAIGVNSGLDFVLVVRYYPSSFISVHGNALGEHTTPGNERGVYYGMKYKLNRFLSLSTHLDLFEFPGLTAQSISPSAGTNGQVRLTYQQPGNFSFQLAGNGTSRVSNDTRQGQPIPETRTRSRFQVSLSLAKFLSRQTDFTCRVVVTLADDGIQKPTGHALLFDGSHRFRRIRLAGGLSMFESATSATGMYVFERDPWLSMSFPLLRGRGTRTYLMGSYQAGAQTTVWLKWSSTNFLTINPDESDDPGSWQVKIQLNRKIR